MALWAITGRVSTPISLAQLNTYATNLQSVVTIPAGESDYFHAKGVTVNEVVVKGQPAVPVPVPTMMLLGIEANVAEARWQQLLEYVNTNLPKARLKRYAGGTLTDAQLDADLRAWALELGLEPTDGRLWQTNRTTSFSGLDTDPVALAARFVAP